ncbi:transcription factor S [Thermococci archaeon]|nr:MAG: transcription factor S [Thermococci archaeon]
MEFCPKCGGVLLPKKGILYCRKCGFEKKIDDNSTAAIIIERKRDRGDEEGNPKGVILIEEEIATLPKAKVKCPKCGNTEAYWWMYQTRAGDEPTTRFYRCTRCKHTWREY